MGRRSFHTYIGMGTECEQGLKEQMDDMWGGSHANNRSVARIPLLLPAKYIPVIKSPNRAIGTHQQAH